MYWFGCRKPNLQICDLSAHIIDGHTSVTQITGTGFEKEREQQRESFALHVVKCWSPWSVPVKKQGEHDPPRP